MRMRSHAKQHGGQRSLEENHEIPQDLKENQTA